MNKKAVAPIFIFLIIGILAFSTIAGIMSSGSLLGYTNVYKQNWGSMCCEQKGNYDVIITKTAEQQSTWRCNPTYTNECDVSIDIKEKQSFITDAQYRKCDASGNCGQWIPLGIISKPAGTSITLQKLKYNEVYQFRSLSTLLYDADLSKFTVTLKAKSFYIKGMENGKIYQQESCVLNSALKQRVLSDGLNQLLFDECQNYMIDFVSVATKTYSYNGQEVICQARNLYSIENEQFKDGSTKKIQGNKIKSVECCPTESNCDENKFEFVKAVVKECSYDSECSNGGDPVAVSGTAYVTFNCISNKCIQSSEKSVECTNNAICIQKNGAGSVCDLSAFNYGKCKTATEVPDYCGDGVCSSVSGETKLSCPADCGDYSQNSWPWYVWALIIALIIAGVIILYPTIISLLNTLRMSLKGIPIIGRIIP